MHESTLELNERANGQTFEIAIGQSVKIALAENPTTGFRWSLDTDGSPALALKGDGFVTPGEPPGRGGTRHWTFDAVAAGQAEVRAVYRRNWDPKDKAANTFRIVVVVAPKT